jgi:hypothetical protein
LAKRGHAFRQAPKSRTALSARTASAQARAMGNAGTYVTWGVVQISLTNLVIVLLMMAVFAVAVLVPLGRRDRESGR